MITLQDRQIPKRAKRMDERHRDQVRVQERDDENLAGAVLAGMEGEGGIKIYLGGKITKIG